MEAVQIAQLALPRVQKRMPLTSAAHCNAPQQTPEGVACLPFFLSAHNSRVSDHLAPPAGAAASASTPRQYSALRSSDVSSTEHLGNAWAKPCKQGCRGVAALQAGNICNISPAELN